MDNYFTNVISMTQLRELSQRLPAKDVLYVMEACYSGQGFNRALGLDPGAFLMPQVSQKSGNIQTPQYGRLDGEGDVVFAVTAKKSA